MEDFDQLLSRLEEESEKPCADRRHLTALRDAARVLRAMNDVSEPVMQALTYPHEPAACPNPEHVGLLREATHMLDLSMQMIPDGLRYLAAKTPDAYGGDPLEADAEAEGHHGRELAERAAVLSRRHG
jgi:hypothetical protein